MINHHFSTVFGALVAFAALTAPANTAEQTSYGIAPTGQREYSAKLLVCAICHGEKGVPKNPMIPVIWGQQESYLLKQLHDFEKGDRAFEAMGWMAKTFSQEEQGSAAAYFAKKSWPARIAAAAASASPPGTVAVCQACHQENFAGGVAAPRLAGQSYEYLVEAMRRFADGERANNADMTNLMKAISPAEREAMARFISGL